MADAPRPFHLEHAELGIVEVAEDVGALEALYVRSSVAVAADDGRPQLPSVVVDRPHRMPRHRPLVDQPALVPVPPVVLAAPRAAGLEVDLLARGLPDVTDPQVVGLPVEGPPPGVPQAEGPDLRAGS